MCTYKLAELHREIEKCLHLHKLQASANFLFLLTTFLFVIIELNLAVAFRAVLCTNTIRDPRGPRKKKKKEKKETEKRQRRKNDADSKSHCAQTKLYSLRINERQMRC